MGSKRLGVGFVGGGFNARFHIRSFTSVRDADVRGIVSRSGRRGGVGVNYYVDDAEHFYLVPVTPTGRPDFSRVDAAVAERAPAECGRFA